MSYSPDLSGIDWSYYVSTYQRTIFRYNQKVLFEVPVFQNERLEVIKLGVINTPLVYGVDYIIYDDDIDYDAMSVCKNMDTNFDKILLKSLTILSFVPATSQPFKVQIKFNQLFADSINYARINQAQEIEVTPTLISNMVEQINYLQQTVLDNPSEYSEQSSITRVALNEYPNGDSDENLILGEVHDIDTTSGKCLIRPIYGSFFRDSVVVKNQLTQQELIVDTEFEILDLDLSRTRTTSNPSGIYRIIKVLKPTVGAVEVDYRAYGGIADVASIRYLQDRLALIEGFLTNTSHITPSTLPADPTIIGIRNKLQEMEGTMRLLLRNGLPTYGDVSTGTAVLKRVVSQDTNLHWWSIATLYRVEGSVDDVLADVFKFRLKSLISKMMFECSVSVNTEGSSDNRFKVTCENSNVPKDVLEKHCPKLRILEVSAGGVYSGVILQLGMKLSTGVLQETFDIEDMSGRESCWKLVPFSATSTPPEDTGVLMPNGVAIFTYNDSAAVVNETVIPFKEGLQFLIEAANIPVEIGNLSNDIFGTSENFDFIIPELEDVEIKNASAFLISMIVDIGNVDQRSVDFIVPINSKDEINKQYFGYCETELLDIQYKLVVKLRFDAPNDRYVIGYYMAGSSSVNTLNVVSTKLIF